MLRDVGRPEWTVHFPCNPSPTRSVAETVHSLTLYLVHERAGSHPAPCQVTIGIPSKHLRARNPVLPEG